MPKDLFDSDPSPPPEFVLLDKSASSISGQQQDQKKKQQQQQQNQQQPAVSQTEKRPKPEMQPEKPTPAAGLDGNEAPEVFQQVMTKKTGTKSEPVVEIRPRRPQGGQISSTETQKKPELQRPQQSEKTSTSARKPAPKPPLPPQLPPPRPVKPGRLAGEKYGMLLTSIYSIGVSLINIPTTMFRSILVLFSTGRYFHWM